MNGWYLAVDGSPNGPHMRDDLERLLLTGQINRKTLVWRKGMPRWTVLGSVDELNGLLESIPPPLPSGPQRRKPAPKPEAQLEGPGPFRQSSSTPHKTDSIVQPDDDHNKKPVTSIHTQGGPWSRYFARQFDITVNAIVIAFIIEFSLPYISIDTYLAYSSINNTVAGIGIIALAFALNALTLTAFGNSLGKAMLGLRAFPVDGTGRFDIAGNFKRELRVWIFGAAMAIPIFALFTFIANYREVSVGRPAIYDRRFAKIKVKPIGATRRALAMIFTGCLLVGSLTWAKMAEDQISSNGESGNVEKSLRAASAKWNKNLPKKIDKFTILEKTSTMDRQFTYHYRLEIDPSQRDSANTYVNKNVPNLVCKEKINRNMMRHYGVVYIYKYRIKNTPSTFGIRLDDKRCRELGL